MFAYHVPLEGSHPCTTSYLIKWLTLVRFIGTICLSAVTDLHNSLKGYRFHGKRCLFCFGGALCQTQYMPQLKSAVLLSFTAQQPNGLQRSVFNHWLTLVPELVRSIFLISCKTLSRTKTLASECECDYWVRGVTFELLRLVGNIVRAKTYMDYQWVQLGICETLASFWTIHAARLELDR
jgi:hypothetical protein